MDDIAKDITKLAKEVVAKDDLSMFFPPKTLRLVKRIGGSKGLKNLAESYKYRTEFGSANLQEERGGYRNIKMTLKTIYVKWGEQARVKEGRFSTPSGMVDADILHKEEVDGMKFFIVEQIINGGSGTFG